MDSLNLSTTIFFSWKGYRLLSTNKVVIAYGFKALPGEEP